MSMFRKDPLKEMLYEPDGTIFKPREMPTLSLPEETSPQYEEEQSFSQIWLWLLMGIETMIVIGTFILTGLGIGSILIGAGAMLLTLIFLSVLKLRTRMDDEGVHYRMVPIHWKERTIPWNDLDQIYVRKYSPILEYGGWGIRFGRNGRAINVRGNYGIQMVTRKGKRILIGTQQPEAAIEFLRGHPILV